MLKVYRGVAVSSPQALREIEAGVDVIRSSRSFDLVLICRFDDRAGLDQYTPHPVHTEVVQWIRSVREDRGVISVDFES